MHTIENHLILNDYQKFIYSKEGSNRIKYAKKYVNTEEYQETGFASKRNRF